MITAFSYKQGNSFLHRCPAIVKILFLPLLSLAVFILPWQLSLAIICLQTLAGLLIHLTIGEQLCDLQAVLYYAVLLIFAKLVAALFTHSFTKDFFTDFIPSLLLLLKLLCLMQTASLLFKTSSSLQLRQAFEKIELALRRFFHLPVRAPIAQMLALFICFIPQVSKNWSQSKRAWLARGGKKNLRMLAVLLPVLFSLGMKQAYNTARAIAIRSTRPSQESKSNK